MRAGWDSDLDLINKKRHQQGAVFSFADLIQKIYTFRLVHWGSGEARAVEVGGSHFYAADIAAVVGGEIIGQGFGVHAGGIFGPQLSFVGLEQSDGLIDGAHNVEEPRDRFGLSVARVGVIFGIYCSDEARA